MEKVTYTITVESSGYTLTSLEALLRKAEVKGAPLEMFLTLGKNHTLVPLTISKTERYDIGNERETNIRTLEQAGFESWKPWMGAKDIGRYQKICKDFKVEFFLLDNGSALVEIYQLDYSKEEVPWKKVGHFKGTFGEVFLTSAHYWGRLEGREEPR